MLERESTSLFHAEVDKITILHLFHRVAVSILFYICCRTQEDRMLTTESTRIESMVQKLDTLCQKMVTGDLIFGYPC
jgi:hypothetical protein